MMRFRGICVSALLLVTAAACDDGGQETPLLLAAECSGGGDTDGGMPMPTPNPSGVPAGACNRLPALPPGDGLPTLTELQPFGGASVSGYAVDVQLNDQAQAERYIVATGSSANVLVNATGRGAPAAGACALNSPEPTPTPVALEFLPGGLAQGHTLVARQVLVGGARVDAPCIAVATKASRDLFDDFAGRIGAPMLAAAGGGVYTLDTGTVPATLQLGSELTGADTLISALIEDSTGAQRPLFAADVISPIGVEPLRVIVLIDTTFALDAVMSPAVAQQLLVTPEDGVQEQLIFRFRPMQDPTGNVPNETTIDTVVSEALPAAGNIAFIVGTGFLQKFAFSVNTVAGTLNLRFLGGN